MESPGSPVPVTVMMVPPCVGPVLGVTVEMVGAV